MVKTIEPLPTVLLGYALYALAALYLYRFFNLVFNKKIPVEKAVIDATYIFADNTKPLQKQEPELQIDNELNCSIRDQPAYDFEGNEFQDVRNVKCADCHNYVYKQGDKCFPYKHNSDEGYCEVNTAISGLCPFDIQ
jgi:hypothetical protein